MERMPNLNPKMGPPPSKLALAIHTENIKDAIKKINAGRIHVDAATGRAVMRGLVGNRLFRRRVAAMARAKRPGRVFA